MSDHEKDFLAPLLGNRVGMTTILCTISSCHVTAQVRTSYGPKYTVTAHF